MNKINRMITKQSTNPVNPGNPVQKPPTSQLCSPPNASAHRPGAKDARNEATTPAPSSVQPICSASFYELLCKCFHFYFEVTSEFSKMNKSPFIVHVAHPDARLLQLY